jgi:hypothetical protein
MATSIDVRRSPCISKKRKRSPSLHHGIVTPPTSLDQTFFIANEYAASLVLKAVPPPSPPSSIEPSPEPPTTDACTKLLTLLQQLKNGQPIIQTDTFLSITPLEFSSFEHILAKKKSLSRFVRKKLRYEWIPKTRLFAIRVPDLMTQKIVASISQCCKERFGELADSKHTLKGIDSWERERVKELADMVRPLALRTLDIGQGKMSPDFSFGFGPSGSLLGSTQIALLGRDPLVVFEVRYSKPSEVRNKMEERARVYLEEPRYRDPFKHNVRTVVLIYYTQEDTVARMVYITVSHIKVENGKRVITTQAHVMDLLAQTRSGHIGLSLSDFLPIDAIELSFRENVNGTRACDCVKIDMDITEAVWHATGREQDVLKPDNAISSTSKRRRIDSVGEIEERLGKK